MPILAMRPPRAPLWLLFLLLLAVTPSVVIHAFHYSPPSLRLRRSRPPHPTIPVPAMYASPADADVGTQEGSRGSSPRSTSSPPPRTVELTDWLNEGERFLRDLFPWSRSKDRPSPMDKKSQPQPSAPAREEEIPVRATRKMGRMGKKGRRPVARGGGRGEVLIEASSTSSPPPPSPPPSTSLATLSPRTSTTSSTLLPVRIQRELTQLWAEIREEGRLDYLTQEDMDRLKKTLVILSAFQALFDHPLQVLEKRSADDIFRAADVNSDGQLSFEEFLKWYNETANKSQPRRKDRSGAWTSAPSSAGGGKKPGLKDILRGEVKPKKGMKEVAEVMVKAEARALEELDRRVEMTQLLLDLKADAETVIAALASSILQPEDGNTEEKLDVIRTHCGPVVHQIVSDSMRLKQIFHAQTSEGTYFRLPDRSVDDIMDLDHQNARRAREYLLAANRDGRAFVVHMASLLYSLRNQRRLPLHERHVLALEALQLYVPVANALGLGSELKDLEELSYRALFPDTYSGLAAWHKGLSDAGQVALAVARDQITHQIESRPHLRDCLSGYDIQCRVKSILSTFKKVFRQDKIPEEVHDMIGIRIILDLKPTPNLLPPAAADVDDYNEEEEEEERRGVQIKSKLQLESEVCHEVYSLVTSLWREVPGRYKNYVDYPKPNGYRSVHLGVYLGDPGGAMAEVQIRTSEMHMEAEHGTASHSLYKGEIDTPESVESFRLNSGVGGGKRLFLLPSDSGSDSSSSSDGSDESPGNGDLGQGQAEAEPP